MKKKLAISIIFLMTYVVFLIATLPATVLLNQIVIPKEINISGVSGSVWHTNIEQLTVGKTSVSKVKSSLNAWSLFTLTPTLAITFGDALIAGPEGQLQLALSQEKAQITDLTLLIKANDIAQQLSLPIPMSAQGDIEVKHVNAEVDLLKNNQCIAAKGNVVWSKSGVMALDQNIKLGDISADIECDKGALALIISPKNDLGLTFTAYMKAGGQLSGNGFLTPGTKFPKTLNNLLPFLGKQDNQGRYRLTF